MKTRAAAGRVLIGLWIVIAISASGQRAAFGAIHANEWPFGNDTRDEFSVIPPGDFVMTIGAAISTPGVVALATLGSAFRADPFFTRGMTDITTAPTFTAMQSLETGIGFDWWSAFVDMNLSLVPWALASTGGRLEIHPPTWMVVDRPAVTMDTQLGWGPQWIPVSGWTHALTGELELQSGWELSTFWEHPLDLVATTNLSAAWTFPDGDFAPDWHVALKAQSVLPLFPDHAAAVRAGATARVAFFPVFGVGFDMRLEFRFNAFYAYGLVGAGGTGIRAEVGANITFGLNLFGDVPSIAETE